MSSGRSSNTCEKANADFDVSPDIIAKRAADVEPQRLRRMWGVRFFRGKLGFIAGDPGLGKSQIGVCMAATVSTGGTWPGGKGRACRGGVIYISAEDTSADTIRPRLEAAGADLNRVLIVEGIEDKEVGQRPFSLVADLGRLDAILAGSKKPRLVIIDPINACLAPVKGQSFNSNSVTHVRALLGRLEIVARKYGVAIVGITHLTKAKANNVLSRVVGSVAHTAAARSVYIVMLDSGDPTRRIFAPAKNNLGGDINGLAYRIREREIAGGIRTSFVDWEEKPVNRFIQ
jgi:putative DNA primase/helicase